MAESKSTHAAGVPLKRPRFPASLPPTAVGSLPFDAINNIALSPMNPVINGGFATKTSLSKGLSVASAQTATSTQQNAARHADRPVAASQGVGLVGEVFRRQMVSRLRASGVANEAVLDAFAQVPRHCFVDPGLASQAYEDTSLPIGLGQTISKPSVVARMLELLLAAPGASAAQAAGRGSSGRALAARVLEIGTGCGYQVALLAHLALHVTSIERLSGLHDKAVKNLEPLGLVNIELLLGDGMLGHARSGPYLGIIAAAGGEAIPQAWVDQLAPGGRIVAPVAGVDGQQWLTVVDKRPDGLKVQRLAVVQFVPLKSGVG